MDMAIMTIFSRQMVITIMTNNHNNNHEISTTVLVIMTKIENDNHDDNSTQNHNNYDNREHQASSWRQHEKDDASTVAPLPELVQQHRRTTVPTTKHNDGTSVSTCTPTTASCSATSGVADISLAGTSSFSSIHQRDSHNHAGFLDVLRTHRFICRGWGLARGPRHNPSDRSTRAWTSYATRWCTTQDC